MPKLRIFLADDHAVVRAGLKTLINAEADMHVVGEAADGREATEKIPALAPDIAVFDVSMPELNGAQATRRLKTTCPKVKVIALTVHEDRSYITDLLTAGATGYLVKRAAAAELITAIRAVAGGGLYVDPRVAGKLVGPLAGGPRPPASELSKREAEVLQLVAHGHSHKEIAAQLEVSLKTVETYKARSMEKLGLRSRVDIIRHASEVGWLRPATLTPDQFQSGEAAAPPLATKGTDSPLSALARARQARLRRESYPSD